MSKMANHCISLDSIHRPSHKPVGKVTNYRNYQFDSNKPQARTLSQSECETETLLTNLPTICENLQDNKYVENEWKDFSKCKRPITSQALRCNGGVTLPPLFIKTNICKAKNERLIAPSKKRPLTPRPVWIVREGDSRGGIRCSQSDSDRHGQVIDICQKKETQDDRGGTTEDDFDCFSPLFSVSPSGLPTSPLEDRLSTSLLPQSPNGSISKGWHRGGSLLGRDRIRSSEMKSKEPVERPCSRRGRDL
eukprot:Seg504.2 transcript_id=Seg504.2/GoldUCD/mRNA.D3Y31 product="hypothetical protein" protein_id=Seg504.2/GoldUCD/D3Y31